MFDISRYEIKPETNRRFNTLFEALNKSKILSEKYLKYFPEYFTVHTSTFVIDKQLYILDELIGTKEPYSNNTICLVFKTKEDIERLLNNQAVNIFNKVELNNWFIPNALSYTNLEYYALKNNLN